MEGKKRKKCGYEYRKEKKSKQLKESAKECSKITQFYSNPKYANDNSSENNQTLSQKDENYRTESTRAASNFAHCSNLESEAQSYREENAHESITLDIHLTEECATEKENSNYASSPNEELTDYFRKPSQEELLAYLAYHPVQPCEKTMPFQDRKPLFTNIKKDKNVAERQWLTFNEKTLQLFCYLCMAFSNNKSVFCTGFNDWRHVHQRVEEHETSKGHMESVKSFTTLKGQKTAHDLLFDKQIEKRKQQVQERRSIIEIIVDIIKFIGKQGLPYRGSAESAYMLDNEHVNHGNFLELILLLKKYVPSLEQHLNNITKQSFGIHAKHEEQKKEKEKRTVGRGSFVTFLSKTTVVNIICIILEEMKLMIAEEIRNAVKFSVMMDTTIDVSSHDQCAFVFRYVKDGKVIERLLSLKCVSSTTGLDLFNTLKDVLEHNRIELENCVANAFDGASNMSGKYKGVAAKLAEMVPNHLHTWCYSHVLNLVLSDTSQCLPITISFFNLLQETQVFLKESLKRMQMFLEQNPHFKLEAIGATRWRSKSNATAKLFGRIDDWRESVGINFSGEVKQSKNVYLNLIIALHKMSNCDDFNAKIRNDASALLAKFLSYETILVAMVFLTIFKVTTPLSDYLQTKNLDYVQAWRLIESSSTKIKKIRDEFPCILAAANTFVEKMSSSLEEINDDSLQGLELEIELKRKRITRKKKMSGELAEDENIALTAEDNFRISVFYRIVDTIYQTMDNRFMMHKALYLDLSCFDPKRFPFHPDTFPPNALERISDLVPAIDKGRLREELISFSEMWPEFSRRSVTKEYADLCETTMSDFGDSDESEEECIKCDGEQQNCNNCIKCILKVLINYNMFSVQYKELFQVCKYLLTIPLTQVSCERVFSKLKIIKSRLRAKLNDEHLEAFVMMASEKDVLNSVSYEVVIKKLIEKSIEMRRLLSF